MKSNDTPYLPACLLAHDLINKLPVTVGFCDLLSDKLEQDAMSVKQLHMIRDMSRFYGEGFGDTRLFRNGNGPNWGSTEKSLCVGSSIVKLRSRCAAFRSRLAKGWLHGAGLTTLGDLHHRTHAIASARILLHAPNSIIRNLLHSLPPKSLVLALTSFCDAAHTMPSLSLA